MPWKVEKLDRAKRKVRSHQTSHGHLTAWLGEADEGTQTTALLLETDEGVKRVASPQKIDYDDAKTYLAFYKERNSKIDNTDQIEVKRWLSVSSAFLIGPRRSWLQTSLYHVSLHWLLFLLRVCFPSGNNTLRPLVSSTKSSRQVFLLVILKEPRHRVLMYSLEWT